MKKIAIFALSVVMVIGLVGCSSGGVTQAQYDAVVAERDALQKQVEALQAGTEQLPVESAPIESKEPVQAGKFDSASVIAGLEVTPYQWESSIGTHYLGLEIKNTSSFGIDLDGSVTFVDSSGSMIGAQDSSQEAIPAGGTTLLYFNNDEAFSDYKYELSAKESDWFVPVTQDISIESNNTEKKVVISATNNGEIPAEFVEIYALFFVGETPTRLDSTYCIDDDSELKPGATKTCELSCYEAYDSVKLYITGRGTK